MSVWLQENSWEELDELRKTGKNVVIIPVGSTEQHGYHLPLGTDTMVAMTLAEDAAQQTKTVVAPPLWFGWSPHHMALPGTITFRPEVLIEVLYDIIDSLQVHGFQKFIILNGHRVVNISWMQMAAEKAQRQLGVTVVLFDPSFMSKDILKELQFGPVGHSEEIETSHMLYKYPELVDMSKAVDNPVIEKSLYSVDPSFSGDTLCYFPSTVKDMSNLIDAAGGTFGTPSKASAKKGEKYHTHLVNHLIQVIIQLQQS